MCSYGRYRGDGYGKGGGGGWVLLTAAVAEQLYVCLRTITLPSILLLVPRPLPPALPSIIALTSFRVVLTLSRYRGAHLVTTAAEATTAEAEAKFRALFSTVSEGRRGGALGRVDHRIPWSGKLLVVGFQPTVLG